MSIYFQYPTIKDYPNVANSAMDVEIDVEEVKNDDRISFEQAADLSAFLTLKYM